MTRFVQGTGLAVLLLALSAAAGRAQGPTTHPFLATGTGQFFSLTPGTNNSYIASGVEKSLGTLSIEGINATGVPDPRTGITPGQSIVHKYTIIVNGQTHYLFARYEGVFIPVKGPNGQVSAILGMAPFYFVGGTGPFANASGHAQVGVEINPLTGQFTWIQKGFLRY